jgi:hypothetical protein
MKNWQYPPNTGYGRIALGADNLLGTAEKEVGLKLANGDLNRWAGAIGWRAIRHHPLHFLQVGLRNSSITLRQRDMQFFQKPLDAPSHSRRWAASVYGVDASRWDERVHFAWTSLEPLKELKYLLAFGLLISVLLFLKTWDSDYFIAVVVVGFAVVTSFVIFPEERFFNAAENLMILNAGILLADVHRVLMKRRAAAVSSAGPTA